jgi:BirA family biotin operon repressor/biotin-[acetyl-CoA-carboxylase] ligase
MAPPGVVTASFVLERVPVGQLPGLSLLAGLAVIQAIAALLPDGSIPLRLKWPNDVLVNDRKLAGILCEAASGSHSAQTRVIVGIGFNRCVDWAQSGIDTAALGQPTSLHEWLPPTQALPAERSLLAELRRCLLKLSILLAQPNIVGITPWLPELRRFDALANRTILFDSPQGQITGRATGVDAWGRLLVQSASGHCQAFASGRIIGWEP